MLILKPTCSVCQRAEEKERNWTKMTEIQPCMVAFKRKGTKKGGAGQVFSKCVAFQLQK